MGVDINGWVDIKDPRDGRWATAILIEWLVERNYAVFGGLFGHRDVDGFAPVAAGRGLPSDRAAAAERSPGVAPEDTFKPTWILWSEIAAIDWEEEGAYQVHRYLDKVPEPGEAPDSQPSEDKRWKRKELVDESWQTLFDLMEVLARRYGGDGVRLVVWFDS